MFWSVTTLMVYACTGEAADEYCHQFRQDYFDLPLMTCVTKGQELIVKWEAMHPGWTVENYSCTQASQSTDSVDL